MSQSLNKFLDEMRGAAKMMADNQLEGVTLSAGRFCTMLKLINLTLQHTDPESKVFQLCEQVSADYYATQTPTKQE